MNLLFDSNIILFIIRANNYKGIINYLNPDNHGIFFDVLKINAKHFVDFLK